MKWLKNILLVLIIIILSPLILFIFLCYLIAMPFLSIANRIAYKKSAYFRDIKVPYNKNIIESNKYDFYNYAIEDNLPIKYIKQKTKSLEYFIYENQIFLFPDFNCLKFNEDKNCWEVIKRHYDEETIYSLDEYLNKEKCLFETEINLPVKLLVSRYYFEEGYIDIAKLPEALYVIRNYHSAFKKEKQELLSMIPQNTEELYEMMLKNDKLGGSFKLESNDLIVWTFDQVIYEISLKDGDGYFGVNKNNKLKSNITHWHPDNFDIYEDVCNIGEKGNVLIIKSFLGSSFTIYMGPKEKCTFNKDKKHLGKIYYFESK